MKGWGGRCASKVQGLCVCVRVQVCLQGGVGDCVCERWSVCVRASCICGGCAYACETLRSKFLKFS